MKIACAVTIGCIVAFFFFDDIMSIFLKPFQAIDTLSSGATAPTLFVNSLFEGFAMRMHFSMIFGLVFAFPVIVYQILRFILPGLKSREKKLILWSIVSALILAILGVVFVYYFLLPYSINMLTSSEFIPKNVGLLLNYQENVFYVFNILLGAMVIFQFPILLMVLMFLNITTRKTLLKLGRYIIIIIFIVAAIVTPPDIVSQIGVALPMVILFYGTILLAKILNIGNS